LDQKRVPWLVGMAIAAAALLFSPGSARSPAAPVSPTTAAPSPPSGAAEPPMVLSPNENGGPPENSWRPYVRLYEDFFGTRPLSTDSARQVRGTWGGQRVDLHLSAAVSNKAAGPDDLEKIAKNASEAGYNLEFLVALVPDPIDSRLATSFDLSLEGLQMGLAQLDFVLDRRWLPWTAANVAGEDGGGRIFHEAAGMMLFHSKPQATGTEKSPCRTLLAVLLVGETPRAGIHKLAFSQALGFIGRLEMAAAASPPAACEAAGQRPSAKESCQGIRILGPFFSQSAESLRLAIRSQPKDRFCIISGSASAPGLEQFFKAPDAGLRPDVAEFGRTVLPDDELVKTALHFLHKKLGWDLSYAALLISEDTPNKSDYFVSLHDSELGLMGRFLFPSGLHAIRSAAEASSIGGAPGAVPRSGYGAPTASQIALDDLSIADPVQRPDDIPEFGALTIHIQEVGLANLLQRISRFGFRYVGILATDIKDEVFLAEQVRRLAPDVVVFLFQKDLIYLHPHSSSSLLGMLTISSFPIIPRGARSGLRPEKTPAVVVTRGFGSQASHSCSDGGWTRCRGS
jgi:hypothetical protein